MGHQEIHKPDHHHYVITEDLFPIMSCWAEHTGFTIPSSYWFAHNHMLLRRALEKIMNPESDDTKRTILIDSLSCHYVASELQQLIYGMHSDQKANIDLGCVISLDPVYGLAINCPHSHLEINRLVNVHGEDIGHTCRPGARNIDDQVRSCAQTMTSNHVIVVDDGIWTGETLRYVINALKKYSIQVEAVIVGIHPKRSGTLIDLDVPHNRVMAVQTYGSNRPIIDWVCERDFFLGIPYGGRTVSTEDMSEKQVGAYYSEKELWLANWASITDRNSEFKQFCFQRSIKLFQEIERLSGKPVCISDLERIPFSVSLRNPSPDRRFLECLSAL